MEPIKDILKRAREYVRMNPDPPDSEQPEYPAQVVWAVGDDAERMQQRVEREQQRIDSMDAQIREDKASEGVERESFYATKSRLHQEFRKADTVEEKSEILEEFRLILKEYRESISSSRELRRMRNDALRSLRQIQFMAKQRKEYEDFVRENSEGTNLYWIVAAHKAVKAEQNEKELQYWRSLGYDDNMLRRMGKGFLLK